MGEIAHREVRKELRRQARTAESDTDRREAVRELAKINREVNAKTYTKLAEE